MTLTFPLPLAALLDQRVCRALATLYGPGWHVHINGGVEIKPGPPRWAGMTEGEREAERLQLVKFWNRELRVPADGPALMARAGTIEAITC